jgi:zinc protease
MYSQRIKEKKFSWGGKGLATSIAAHGLVSIVGSVSGGAMRAPSEEFAKVHAAMLLEGTKLHTKKEIQILLDEIGASLTFGMTSERLVFSARVRAVHADKLLALIAEILREPSFPMKELATLKKREQANLALEAQEPNAQARIHLTRLLYKKGHPNFDDTTRESLKGLRTITSVALLKHHKKILNGSSLILSMAGESTSKRVFDLTEKHFKDLPRQKQKPPKFAKASAPKTKKKFVAIKNKASVDFMLGITTGITKDHKDYPALLLAINILGLPGFTGRLMQNTREKEGLTYGTSASLSGFDYQTDGHIVLWGAFAPQLFKRGRESILRQVNLMVTEGANDVDVHKHSAMYEASRRVRMSHSMAFASAAHQMAAEGRNMSYLDEFPKKVLKLSRKEVNKVIKKYLVPEKLSESAAGPEIDISQ